jgi:hypothetical protein
MQTKQHKNSLIGSSMRSLKIKVFNWEYWPMWMVYFPVAFYYLYLSVKAKSFFFFSASNPTIETGGMFFESKWSIFKLIPKKYFPTTIIIDEKDELLDIENAMQNNEITFPVIAKPNRGERGWGVRKLKSLAELNEYRNNTPSEFLIQAYVDLPLEFSVFYSRNPNSSKGKITSITLKRLLTVVGDGKSSIEQLILKDDRAFLQFPKLKLNLDINLNKVLYKNEEQILVPYGNHVLGAMFINYNHLIDQTIEENFDNICHCIDGFYFGRFDLRCASIEDLKKGNILILELNGAGAEPAHIYDPTFSYFKAQKVLAQHYKLMFLSAVANHRKGIEYMTYKKFKTTRTLEKVYKQKFVIS